MISTTKFMNFDESKQINFYYGYLTLNFIYYKVCKNTPTTYLDILFPFLNGFYNAFEPIRLFLLVERIDNKHSKLGYEN